MGRASPTPHASGSAHERGRIALFVLIPVVLALAGGLAYTMLHPATTVAIRSQPPGATVIVDGIYLGVTPLDTSSLLPGEHSLKLTRHTFRPHRALFRVKASSRTELTVRLEPEKRYAVTVASTPPGASLSLDGIPTGLRTPAELSGLRAGKHEILVTADGYLPYRRAVDVGEKHPSKVEVVLQSRMESYYHDAIRAEPEVVTNYTELAHHYVIANQFEKAGEILKQGLELACRSSVDKKQVARLQQEIKKIYYGGFDFGGKEAIEQVRPVLERALREVADSCPSAFAPYQLLAAMYASTGKPQEAAKILERGVKLIPDNRALLFYYARTLYRLQEYDRAVAPLEKLVKSHSRNTSARHMLADIYSRMGKTDLAIHHREKIAELMKRSPRAATGALVSLAALYHRKGAYAEAAKRWEQAAALQKDPRMKAQFQISAAGEHAEAGNREKAIALLREVAQFAPDEELKTQARERLRRLRGSEQ